MITESEFVAAYDRSARRVYALMLQKCWNQDLAEDLAQETWYRAWQHRDQFSGESSLDTWVHRIAMNVFLTHLRRRACRPEIQLIAGMDRIIPRPCDAPSEVQHILARCDSKTVKVLRRRYLEEREFEHIDPIPGGTKMRGRALVHRARLAARGAIGIAA